MLMYKHKCSGRWQQWKG